MNKLALFLIVLACFAAVSYQQDFSNFYYNYDYNLLFDYRAVRFKTSMVGSPFVMDLFNGVRAYSLDAGECKGVLFDKLGELYYTVGKQPSCSGCSVTSKGKAIRWDIINYILNHRLCISPSIIQQAIWNYSDDPWLLNQISWFPKTRNDVVEDAWKNGNGFVPQKGQWAAAILRSNDLCGGKIIVPYKMTTDPPASASSSPSRTPSAKASLSSSPSSSIKPSSTPSSSSSAKPSSSSSAKPSASSSAIPSSPQASQSSKASSAASQAASASASQAASSSASASNSGGEFAHIKSCMLCSSGSGRYWCTNSQGEGRCIKDGQADAFTQSCKKITTCCESHHNNQDSCSKLSGQCSWCSLNKSCMPNHPAGPCYCSTNNQYAAFLNTHQTTIDHIVRNVGSKVVSTITFIQK